LGGGGQPVVKTHSGSVTRSAVPNALKVAPRSVETRVPIRRIAFPAGMACFSFAAVVYNVAQVSYRQAICPPRLLGRMNAAVRWVVFGTLPLGAVIGGALGAVIGVRPTLWIAFAGSWAAGWWVYFSPLRRQRDFDLEDHRAPGSGLPGHGGGELPDGAGPQLGD